MFVEKFKKAASKNNSYLCVGLDSAEEKLPEHLKTCDDPIFEFNKQIIDATKDLVCAYKPNLAFYGASGIHGLNSLVKTIDYIPNKIPVILDSKMNDIGNTAANYAKYIFEKLSSDSVTFNPYMGWDSIEPFLKYDNKAVFSLCLTSNSGSRDFQYLNVDGLPLYERVMEKLVDWNNKSKAHVGAVVGATHPEELKKLRQMSDNVIFLIPGIGSQGGDVESVVKNAKLSQGLGIINVSRKIIFASSEKNFAEKSREKALIYKNMINSYL